MMNKRGIKDFRFDRPTHTFWKILKEQVEDSIKIDVMIRLGIGGNLRSIILDEVKVMIQK